MVEKEKGQIFSNFDITKKATNIKLRIDTDTRTIKKKNKILNTVGYRKDEKEEKKEKEQIFSTFNITKQAANIKLKIDTDTKTIKKKNKILNTVEYGNDVNFRNYMLYLDKMRKKKRRRIFGIFTPKK